MSQDNGSYKGILRATSLIGGATLFALVIGLARNKAVALIGGPSAIGLLGLFTSLMTMGSSLATLGVDTSAVRQVAQQAHDPKSVARVTRAVWTLAWFLALLGGAAMWLFRQPLAEFAAGSTDYDADVGWLGIGVFATVLAATQTALFQSHAELGHVARVRVWGSLIATIAGIWAVYRFGAAGIAFAVIALPIANAMVAFLLRRRLPNADWRSLFEARLTDQWLTLATLGALVTLTNVVSSLSQVWVRGVVTQNMGLTAAGLYHASWSVTWVNLSLVLNAMAADFFPRASKASDAKSASVILNQQLDVAFLLAVPALIGVALLAPLVLTILYSASFAQSALLLRLLLISGLLRIAAWALGYALLARGDRVFYLLGEVAGAAALPLLWLATPAWGLAGVGVVAILSSLLCAVTYWIAGHSRHDMRLSSDNARTVAIAAVSLTAVSLLFELSEAAGLAFGLLAVASFAWRSITRLRKLAA